MSTREERKKGDMDESRQKERDERGEEAGYAIDKYTDKRGYSDIMPPKIEPKPNRDAGMQRNTIS